MSKHIKTKILLCLSGDKEKYFPSDILKKTGNVTRRAVNKQLELLRKEGILKREHIRPKEYDLVNWKKLSYFNRSKISRDSYWKIKDTHKAFQKVMEIIFKEDSFKGKNVLKFIFSFYFDKAKHKHITRRHAEGYFHFLMFKYAEEFSKAKQ